MAIDLICKMEVNENEAAFTSNHNGKRYYFCSQNCKNKFDKEPEVFINNIDTDSMESTDNMDKTVANGKGKKISMNISGMTCTSCALRIEKGLKKETGVTDAAVNFASKKALVTITGRADIDGLVRKVKQLGYEAELEDKGKVTEKEYVVQGMSCSSCAITIEKALAEVDGVQDATVSFTDKKARITYDQNLANSKLFAKKVKEAGYELVEKKESVNKEIDRIRREKIRLIAAWAITLPLTLKMLGEMIFGFVRGRKYQIEKTL